VVYGKPLQFKYFSQKSIIEYIEVFHNRQRLQFEVFNMAKRKTTGTVNYEQNFSKLPRNFATIWMPKMYRDIGHGN